MEERTKIPVSILATGLSRLYVRITEMNKLPKMDGMLYALVSISLVILQPNVDSRKQE